MRTETSLLSGSIEAGWLCHELHQPNDQEDRMARWRAETYQDATNFDG